MRNRRKKSKQQQSRRRRGTAAKSTDWGGNALAASINQTAEAQTARARSFRVKEVNTVKMSIY